MGDKSKSGVLALLGAAAMVVVAPLGCGDDSTAGGSGGTSAGGSTNTGGTNTGGTNAGGANTGGTNTGGTNTGGTNTGGTNTGGTNTGGANTGGTNVGGSAGMGGSPPTLDCDADFAWDVTVSHEASLDTLEANQPLPMNKHGAMAASSCGDLGLVYRDSSGGVTYALFTQQGLQKQSSVLSGPIARAPVLYYDGNCEPQVVTMESGSLIQASPSGPDSWETDPIPLTPLTDHSVSGIAGLVLGRDGKWHLFLNGSDSSGQRILHGTLEGTSWSFVSLPTIAWTGTSNFWTSPRVFNFAVDSQGEAHAVYNNGPELGYAVTASGAWQQEIVVPAADDRDVPGFDAYLAIDPDDQPAIANGHSTHHSGWSIKTLKLNYLTRDGGTWTSELIADAADGYEGTDGNKYAGAQVQLSFDVYGQPYMTFNDLASWHLTYNYTAVGQVRYAIKACGQWYHKTIFQQDGQKVSPNPIHECLVPIMAVGSDHETMLFACAERTIADVKASNNNWSSAYGYPSTLQAFVANQQME